MKIETRTLAELTQDPKNARKHDAINLEAIAASLKRFGQQKPIVITKDGRILAGNGTYQAAVNLGWKELQVAVAPENWDEDTETAFAIADNRTAELATWDSPVLLDALTELPQDLVAATGFSSDNVDALLNLFGKAPDLDDLYNEVGKPTEEDGMARVSFVVPQDVADKWAAAVKGAGAGSYLENVCTAIQAAYDAVVSDE
jgi:ParB-like chromosome segregation protein Spo0J